jgi:hypothetical protein
VRIRRAFVAEPGHLLLAADYSQIELRLLAHLAEVPALLEEARARPHQVPEGWDGRAAERVADVLEGW